jgi:hypothetical protein
MQDENASWSWEGAQIMIRYLENLEEQTREEMEFDPVAIRSDYHEYKTIEELVQDFPKLAGLEVGEILLWLDDLVIGQTENGFVVRQW